MVTGLVDLDTNVVDLDVDVGENTEGKGFVDTPQIDICNASFSLGDVEESNSTKMYVYSTLKLGCQHVTDYLLIDSGTSRSYLSTNFLMANFEKMPEINTDESCRSRSATGNYLDILGSVILTLKMGNKNYLSKFFVSSNILSNVLIGRNCLSQIQAVLDFSEGVLQFKDQKGVTMKLYNCPEDSEIEVNAILKSGVKIRPGTSVIVNVEPRGSMSDISNLYGLAMLEPSPSLVGIYATAGLCKIKNDSKETAFVLYNDDVKPVHFEKGICLGKLTSVNNNPIYSSDMTMELNTMDVVNLMKVVTTEVPGNTPLKRKKPRPGGRIKPVFSKEINDIERERSFSEIRETVDSQLKVKEGLLTDAQRCELVDLICEHRAAWSLYGELGRSKCMSYPLYLKEGTSSFFRRSYTLSNTEQVLMRQELAKLVRLGVIGRFAHDKKWIPCCSSALLVAKKGGACRMVADFRLLNARLCVDYFTHISLGENLRRLGGHNYSCYASIDLQSAFWQIGLEESSRKYTIFQAADELFFYNVLPMGISCASAGLSRLTAMLFSKIPHCYHYCDDVCIGAQSFEGIKHILCQVMQVCIEDNVKMSIEKSILFTDELEFCGAIIKNGLQRPHPRYLDTIATLGDPSDQTELRSLIGKVNYLSQYVRNYTGKTSALYRLLKKDIPWEWTEEHKQCVADIKDYFQKDVFLRLPDDPRNEHYILYTDGSRIGLGGVLYSVSKDNQLSVCGYCSRPCTEVEGRSASSNALELFALDYSLKQFRKILYGLPDFSIYTDHKSLRGTLMGSADPRSSKIMAAINRILAFRFTLYHVSGPENCVADFLSRAAAASMKRQWEGLQGGFNMESFENYFDCKEHLDTIDALSGPNEVYEKKVKAYGCIDRVNVLTDQSPSPQKSGTKWRSASTSNYTPCTTPARPATRRKRVAAIKSQASTSDMMNSWKSWDMIQKGTPPPGKGSSIHTTGSLPLLRPAYTSYAEDAVSRDVPGSAQGSVEEPQSPVVKRNRMQNANTGTTGIEKKNYTPDFARTPSNTDLDNATIRQMTFELNESMRSPLPSWKESTPPSRSLSPLSIMEGTSLFKEPVKKRGANKTVVGPVMSQVKLLQGAEEGIHANDNTRTGVITRSMAKLLPVKLNMKATNKTGIAKKNYVNKLLKPSTVVKKSKGRPRKYPVVPGVGRKETIASSGNNSRSNGNQEPQINNKTQHAETRTSEMHEDNSERRMLSSDKSETLPSSQPVVSIKEIKDKQLNDTAPSTVKDNSVGENAIVLPAGSSAEISKKLNVSSDKIDSQKPLTKYINVNKSTRHLTPATNQDESSKNLTPTPDDYETMRHLTPDKTKESGTHVGLQKDDNLEGPMNEQTEKDDLPEIDKRDSVSQRKRKLRSDSQREVDMNVKADTVLEEGKVEMDATDHGSLPLGTKVSDNETVPSHYPSDYRRELYLPSDVKILPTDETLFEDKSRPLSFHGSVPKEVRKKCQRIISRMYSLPFTKEVIAEQQNLDVNFRDLIFYLKHRKLPKSKSLAMQVQHQELNYALIDGVLFRIIQPKGTKPITEMGFRLVIPESLSNYIIGRTHSSAMGANHSGFTKTLFMITKYYYILNLPRKVKECINTCGACLKFRGMNKSNFQTPLTVTSGKSCVHPWDRLQIDFMNVELEDCLGQNKVLVIVDEYSHYAFASPASSDTAAEAIRIVSMLIRQYGLPLAIQSDRGSHFSAQVMSSISTIFGFLWPQGSARSSCSQGLVEHTNKMIRTNLSYIQKSTSRCTLEVLIDAVFAVNCGVLVELGVSPHYLFHGWDVRGPMEVQCEIDETLSSEHRQCIDDLIISNNRRSKMVSMARTLGQAKMKHRFDKNLCGIESPIPGDMVLIDDVRNDHNTGRSKKSQCRRKGPYVVVWINKDNTGCVLKDLRGFYLEDIVSCRLLHKIPSYTSSFPCDAKSDYFIS